MKEDVKMVREALATYRAQAYKYEWPLTERMQDRADGALDRIESDLERAVRYLNDIIEEANLFPTYEVNAFLGKFRAPGDYGMDCDHPDGWERVPMCLHCGYVFEEEEMHGRT